MLPPKLRAVLHALLYRFCPRGSNEATVIVAAVASELGVSERTARRYLAELERRGRIEIIHNGSFRGRDGGMVQRPNTFRVVPLAELEREILTVALPVTPDRQDSPEESITPACTVAAREAARAKWLPTLPAAPTDGIEQEAGGDSAAQQAGQAAADGRLRRPDPHLATWHHRESGPCSGRNLAWRGSMLLHHPPLAIDCLEHARNSAGGERGGLRLGIVQQPGHAGVGERAGQEIAQPPRIAADQRALGPPCGAGIRRQPGRLG